MPFRLLASVGLAFALSSAAALAGGRPVVVELFTSQGCSSCPPANAYLNDLAASRADVLPLAFHVTYWDRLGWKDPFSLREATARQARYGRSFGDGSYTPEIVVDGATGLVGSHRSAIGSAISAAQAFPGTATDVTLARTDTGLAIDLGSGSGSAQVLLIGFDRNHVTTIPRGENSGRTLEESNIVRSVRPVGRWSGKALRLDAPFPEGEDVAVLLEDPDGRIVGASRLP